MAHRIALDPTAAQLNYFPRAAGTARFAYNWALAEWQRQFKAGEKPNQIALRRQLNAIKRIEFPWMTEVSKSVIQASIINLGRAYSHFFRRLKEGKRGKKLGYPQFKKRGKHDAFFAGTFPEFAIDGKGIRLPIIGWVRMHEKLRFNGVIKSASVSRSADRWFVSIVVDTETKQQSEKDDYDFVGVDLGVNILATCSDGQCFDGPKPLKRNLKKLRRYNRCLHRRKIASKNRRKTQEKLARLHYRNACIRKDCLHKITTHLAKTKRVVVLENLNVKGMTPKRSIADIGLYEFRRQLQYKSKIFGCEVIIADRFFSSSKRCSECGWIYHSLKRGEKEWTCQECGVVHNRDYNASKNLEWYGKQQLRPVRSESTPVESLALAPEDSGVKLGSRKQELDLVNDYS